MTASLSFMVEAGEKGNAKKHQGPSSQCLFQSVLPPPAIKLIVRCHSAAHPLQSTASGGAVFLKFTDKGMHKYNKSQQPFLQLESRGLDQVFFPTTKRLRERSC
ncbi:hypothetical protein OIU84_007204 [Salix udensis]|uniref:Uncharacterized protein n=1 Tax=Salix udensis TaxID=889485 RepID=A0AAD6JSI8_9ROSI|nr:hypothetical protein OIU84_007204 [Salix udensis]